MIYIEDIIYQNKRLKKSLKEVEDLLEIEIKNRIRLENELNK